MKVMNKLIFSSLLAVCLASEVLGEGENFQDFMSTAKAAAAKGDFDNAMANFNSAFQLADKPELKDEVVFARNQFLMQNKKYDDAEKLLKEFLADETLPAVVRRKTLNTLARQVMWGRPDEAKQYLDLATTIPTDEINEQAQTNITMGYIYRIRKQPENALEVWLPIMEQKGNIHPAHRSGVGYQIGLIYQQMGDLENARKYFQLAIDYGKKVKYSFDYSASEKALNELNKKN